MALFFVVLLYTYAALSDRVEIAGESLFIDLSRSNFFYISLAVFSLANLFCYIGANLIMRFYANRKDFNTVDTDSFEGKLVAWFFGFGLSLNIFFLCLLMFANFHDRFESVQAGYFSFLIYLGPLLVLGSMVYLVVLFFNNRLSPKS